MFSLAVSSKGSDHRASRRAAEKRRKERRRLETKMGLPTGALSMQMNCRPASANPNPNMEFGPAKAPVHPSVPLVHLSAPVLPPIQVGHPMTVPEPTISRDVLLRARSKKRLKLEETLGLNPGNVSFVVLSRSGFSLNTASL